MSGYGQHQLQVALFQKLTQDTTLMATAAGVYDFVPEFPTYPYVTMGEAAWKDASTLATTMAACEITMRIFSRQGGRAEAAAIMSRLHDLLHNGTLSLTGYTLVLMRFASGNIALEQDGLTYQGVMRFQALLQAE